MLDIRALRADPSAVTTLLARRGDMGFVDAVGQEFWFEIDVADIFCDDVVGGVQVIECEFG